MEQYHACGLKTERPDAAEEIDQRQYYYNPVINIIQQQLIGIYT
jgi:hypothetical protein